MRFLDTNAVLLGRLDDEEFFVISSITLQELESIKTNKNKSDEIKWSARKAVRWLKENEDKYKVVIYNSSYEQIILDKNIEVTPDTKIIACAVYAEKLFPESPDNKCIFVTNDLCCKLIAKNIFGLMVSSVAIDNQEEYKGYKEKVMSDEDMAYFYGHQKENLYDLLTNEYLLIKNSKNEIVDILRWTGETYSSISFPNLKTNYFGEIKPYNKDIYQQMVLNSLDINQVTMIKGPAGTGKSYLALGYLFWLLEKHKIDKIVMFVNPTPTANAAKLGFLPGSQLEKLVDSSVGNMLSGKLGDKVIIDQLVIQNKLDILPMCDIRGYDTTGQNCAVYITEAQNMDISLMKLALQRIGENTKVIIDGDYNAQVDLTQYSGDSNGMRRMSEVFKGHDFYGEIELKNIYRSRIALIAEEM